MQSRSCIAVWNTEKLTERLNLGRMKENKLLYHTSVVLFVQQRSCVGG